MNNYILFKEDNLIINKDLINYIEVYDNNIRIHVLDMPNIIRIDFKNKFHVYKWLVKQELVREHQTVQIFKDIAEHNRKIRTQTQKEISNGDNNSDEEQQ